MADRRLLFALIWIVAVGFAPRAISLDWQSFWLDEVDAIGFARGDPRTLLGMFVRTGENGPLYFLLLRFWIAPVGTSEYAVRYLSLIGGVLCVPLSFAIGARLFDRRTGLIAAALAAGSPYLIWYAQEAKMYALVAALSLASTYLLVRAAHDNRWVFWAAYVVTASLGFYLHLFGAFLVAGQMIAYLATLRWHPWSIRRWLVAAAGLTLPYVPLAVWQLPTFINAPPMAHAFVPLPTLLRILFNRFSINHEDWPAWWVMAPFLALAGLGLIWLVAGGWLDGRTRAGGTKAATSSGPVKIVRDGSGGTPPHPTLSPGERGDVAGTEACPRLPSPRRRGAGGEIPPPEGRVWLLAWLWAPILIVFLLTLRLPVFRDRYLTAVAPAYLLLLAVGLAWVWPAGERVSGGRAAGRLAAAGVLGLGLAAGAAQAIAGGPLARTDFRGAVAVYEAGRQPGDAVGFEATYASRPFLWYAPPETAAVELPYTSGGMSAAEVDTIMSQATAGYRRFWFVEHEEWIWDDRALVRGWLERRGRLVRRVELAGVRVSLYRLG